MTRPSIHTLLSLGLIVLLLTTAAAPAAGQSSEEPWLDRLFGLDESEGGFGSYLAAAEGTYERYTMGEFMHDPNPEAAGDALAEWFNQRSSAWASYANAHIDEPSAGYGAVLKTQYGADVGGTLLNESTA